MTPADTAVAVIEMAEHGQFAEIRMRFAPQLRPLVPAETLRAAWEAEAAKHGPVSSLGTPVTEPAGPGTVVVKVPVTFARETVTVAVELAAAGEESWITGIQLLPASAAEPAAPWQPPPYADPDLFTEHDVTVGDGPLAVPGTLSVPRRGGPVPGWCCYPAPGRTTRTRPSDGTSRSRTSPGGWRPRASPCCALRRSPTPTRTW
jgi:hypothetical protein